jgi:hypothetical protein
MKIINIISIVSLLSYSTVVMAANDKQVAVCSLGFGMLAKDVNRAREILSKADNKNNASQLMGKYLDSIETTSNGNFSENGAKKFIMEHSEACKSIGVKNALQ